MLTRHVLCAFIASLTFCPVLRAQFDSPPDLKVSRPEDKQDVKSTPTLVVNGKKLIAINQFRDVVEEERKKLGTATTK